MASKEQRVSKVINKIKRRRPDACKTESCGCETKYKIDKLDKEGILPFSGYKHIYGYYGSRWIRAWLPKDIAHYKQKLNYVKK